MSVPSSKHLSIRKHVEDVREHLRQSGLSPEDDIVVLSEVLAFIIQSTDANKLSYILSTQSNRFSLRKLEAILHTLSKVFSL